LEPATPDPTRRRFIVVQHSLAFGLARMFGIVGERRNPLLKVVYTLDEALTGLGVPSPRFEPYRVNQKFLGSGAVNRTTTITIFAYKPSTV
jgi:hypothetical protein